MPITRTFLDWSQPALPAAVEHLIARSPSDGITDLSDVLVVLPGRRACRRLLELLVERTDSRLHPPEIITEGEFPEQLYEPQRPFAGRLVQQLAWGEAVRRLSRPLAERVLRHIPEDEDVDGWMAVGELLQKLHRELAAEQLDFGDVLKQGQQSGRFVEQQRWEALSAAQQEYLRILDGLHLWDRQTARLVALEQQECRSDQDIVLIGTVDLNRTTRAMLDQVADRVTALIHAPPSLSRRFDEHGCLKPDAWIECEIDIPEESLRIASGPAEQADDVIRLLSFFDGRWRADDITIGMTDESLVPQVQRRLRQFDVPARWVVGKTVPQTAIYRLLEAVADYLGDQQVEHFAALVRHPDVGHWLRQQGLAEDWLNELDDYLAEHLQQRLGFWLGKSTATGRLRQAHDQVTALLGELSDQPRPLAEWSEAILQIPLSIIGDRDFDPEDLNDRAETDAFKALQTVLAEHADLPESLTPVVTGAQALRLTLDALSGETVPPPPDETAIELLGWLELPLDDAPALVVTSFNEQYVPSSVDADLFLPNRLRQQLGVLDNDRRYARDAYALNAMLASRQQLFLIAGRRDVRGDPLLPSRLTLACNEENIAKRIEAFYDTDQKQPALLPTFGGDLDLLDSQESPGLCIPSPRPLPEPKREFPVTAFRDYIACPYRFYLKHILKLSAVEDELEEMSPPQFGTLLHAVLADFGGSECKASTDARQILETLNDLLTERANRSLGRWRRPAIEVQLEQIRSRLEAFSEWQAEWAAAGWTIESVEAELTVELSVYENGTCGKEDRGSRIEYGNSETLHPPSSILHSPSLTQINHPDESNTKRSLILHGRIDRIDRHPDGRWAIFDYKTGEAGQSPKQTHRKRDEWIDLQLPLYRELAAVLGVAGQIELGYINLSKDTKSDIGQLADWTPDELESARATAIEIARKILDQEFLPVTDLDGDRYDDFAAICQQGVFERRSP